MFIVFLTFSENKAQAGELMAAHNAWLQQGFDDGVFLLAGSIKPGKGGSIIAHNTAVDKLQHRIAQDPFVEQRVVTAEIHEIAPSKIDSRLAFLA
ncbi:YciI family protein [Planctobacterium marinum]|uniref:YciI family protein n=1 Tax=Planctobacterium marinum TaxID=1631968 RepID=UPI001E2A08AD|nr:YciI family protein [Planctobacterium marinum]MCC2605798.1 YciI family protein [Planctobacterium marinum]